MKISDRVIPKNKSFFFVNLECFSMHCYKRIISFEVFQVSALVPYPDILDQSQPSTLTSKNKITAKTLSSMFCCVHINFIKPYKPIFKAMNLNHN